MSARRRTSHIAHTTAGGSPVYSFNKNVNYAYNTVSALGGIGTDMIGSNPNATTNVVSSATFRGSGALNVLTYGNGRRLTMGYDPLRPQPTSMKVDMVSDATNKVLDYEYDYQVPGTGGNNNRIRKITDKIDTQYTTTYTYDAYNRLQAANWSGDGRFYQYDEWGNIKSVNIGLTYHYTANSTGAPATNRLDSVALSGVTQTTYGYDAAGNTTSGEGKTFAYDAVNRLKSVNGGASTYGYDGDGKRVRVTDAGASVFYIYSSALGQSVMDVTSSGVQRAYVYFGNNLVAMRATDGQFYWLHKTHLGNSRAMTDGSGNLTYKGQFDPYGASLSEWSASGNTSLNNKKFTGYERDSSGLDYANARMYNPARGRFLTPDPVKVNASRLRRPQRLNLYSYALNDPVNMVDPTGRDGVSVTSNMCSLGLVICDSVTVSAGLGGTIPLGPRGDLFDGNFLPEDGPVDGGSGGISQAQALEQMLRDTVDLATQTLQGKPECAALFGIAPSMGDAANFLGALYSGNQGIGSISLGDLGGVNNEGNIFNAETKGISGYITLPSGAKQHKFTGADIVINTNPDSLFVRGYNINGQQRFGVDDVTNRAITLLHELGHAAAIISGFSSSIVDDQGNAKASAANSQLVYEKCFK